MECNEGDRQGRTGQTRSRSTQRSQRFWLGMLSIGLISTAFVFGQGHGTEGQAPEEMTSGGHRDPAGLVATTAGPRDAEAVGECPCGTDTTGAAFCFESQLCGAFPACQSNLDCGPGERCLANNCCDPPFDFSCTPECGEDCEDGGTCDTGYELCVGEVCDDCADGAVNACMGNDACHDCETPEGNCPCVQSETCDNLVPCPDGTVNCPEGMFCCVNTCCEGPVCLAPCESGACEGDTCDVATIILELPYTDEGATCDCTNDYDEYCPFQTSFAPDRVYAYTPPVDTIVNITLCTGETNYDTKMYVYEGGCPAPGTGATFTDIACNDDACANPPFFNSPWVSEINDLTLLGGITYYIVIDGYFGNCGNYTLDIDFDPCQFEDTPPEAEITSPTENDCVCDTEIIEGSAYDPDGTFTSYTLDYRRVGDANWTKIITSLTPVVSGPLGTWNTGALSSGYYFIRLTVRNDCGLETELTRLVWMDAQFDSLIVRYPVSGDIVGGHVCLDGTVWDNRCFDEYVAEYRPSGGGMFFPVDPGTPVYTSTVINDPFAWWDTRDLALPDGNYDLRVTGTTDCGFQDESEILVRVDNTPPTAEITDPMNCDAVTGVVRVNGTANDANMSSWVLQYTGGAAHGWVTINSGTTSVVDGPLGSWDVSSLENCCYTLRLRVVDAANLNCNSGDPHVTDYMTSVKVGTGGDFDVDDDGDVDLYDYTFFVPAFTGPF